MANTVTAPTHRLHPTVGDELQGVYDTVGAALQASIVLRLALAPDWQVRCGIGGGELVEVGDGIQDGPAWWQAREAINWVKALAAKPGYSTARTAIRDQRPQAAGAVDALSRLLDAQLHRLKPGSLVTLRGLLAGLDNAAMATAQGISASANTQRIVNNDLRPLADALRAMFTLP